MASKTVESMVIDHIPLVALKDVVIYPDVVVPLFVGRKKSIEAVEVAMTLDKKLFLVAQKDPECDNPKIKDMYTQGTLASILQILRLPDGSLKVLVEGISRAKFLKSHGARKYFDVAVEVNNTQSNVKKAQQEIIVKSLLAQFEQYVQLNRQIPSEVVAAMSEITNASRLVDTIAAHIQLEIEERQEILEIVDAQKRADKLMTLLDAQMDKLNIDKKIHGRVKRQMEDNQKEYWLHEQMKAIRKELGDVQGGASDLDELERKIKKAKMPKEALEKTMAELAKLKEMPAMSAETTVSRSYIDAMIAFPWSKSSPLKKDIVKAQEILDHDHFGLEKVKERIVEYLAVEQRVSKIQGPILCLVGPPGVGKTSLGASIAQATGREFVRVSLGGVHDEAEIRGHRRTYVGAMPGKVVQRLSKAGANNPLFMFDEIDKMSSDFRGDPASAMLEVLDSSQNNAFNDHFLEVDCDLSKVMFVCTANSLNIPLPLLDRMEIIRLPGYTEDEKFHIAKNYLIPRAYKAAGLKKSEMSLADSVVIDMIRYYSREAGVRSLEREIAKVARKVVKELLLNKRKKKISVTSKNLEDFLGVKKYRYGVRDEDNQVGQVTGLAWTEVGGELLKIETASVPGKGKIIRTGKLGDVMKESIEAAITVVRSRSKELKIAEDYFEKHDIHVHVPEGATPKDGPSAGTAICTAVISQLTKKPVRADIAMTGEITLRGEVLPIGGLKEKLIAAKRGGIKTVLIPDDNERELSEVPDNVKADLNIIPVKWIDQVIKVAFAKGKASS